MPMELEFFFCLTLLSDSPTPVILSLGVRSGGYYYAHSHPEQAGIIHQARRETPDNKL